MNKKKMLSVLLGSFFANLILVYAQDGLLNDWLRFIFIDLSDLAESGDQIFIVYFKIILFFLVFTVLYWSGQKVFHEQPKIAGTVAFIISLASVILLPGHFIILIFNTYSIIIGYAFILLPVIVGLFLAYKFADEKKSEHPHLKRLLKGIIFIVIAILTFSLSATLTASGSDVYYEVAKWARIGGVICLLAGLFYIVTCWERKKDRAIEETEGN